MAGRPRKPSHLRLVEGHRGHRPIPEDPEAPKGIPTCPPGLDPTARAAWTRMATRLHEMGVLALADREQLELAAQAYSDGRRARAALKAHGSETYTTTSSSGGVMHRSHPEIAHRNDADRRLGLALGQLGLSPAARAKLGAAPKDPISSTYFPPELKDRADGSGA